MNLMFSRLYKAPREFNWWTTLILSLFVFALAHTGYLLPWDQRAYMATEIFTNIVGNTPVVGNEVKQIIQGGADKGQQTITRLYALHVMILPILILLTFVVHWSWLHRTWKKERELVQLNQQNSYLNFWPGLFTQNAIGCLLLTCLLTALTIQHQGADITGPADSSNPYTAARPEWYFLFLFRFLRTPIVEQLGLAFGAIHLPGIIVALLVLMPLIGKTKIGHYFNVTFASCLLLGVIGLTTFSILEDARNEDHQHAVKAAQKDAERTIQLAGGPAGIPVTGALELLRNDPYIQGGKIFASRCASCHYYDGHDGTGEKPKELAKAPDLGNFGSREWMRAVLTDFKGVFAAVGPTKIGDIEVGKNILTGEMAKWSSDHREILLKKENEVPVNQLIEFLYAQSEREQTVLSEKAMADIAAGQEIYEIGVLSDAAKFELACLDCHTIKPVGSDKVLKSSGEGLVLTGYASKEWLRSFIKNPATKEHYGFTAGHNAMPGFETQLTEQELELLIRWMLHDYIPPTVTTTKEH
jgi:ubiquinol-cytochrome c reductase cytochrome b subunit